MNSNISNIKILCLVRDKNGKPKFDDINNIPKKIWDILTTEEKQDIRDGINTLPIST